MKRNKVARLIFLSAYLLFYPFNIVLANEPINGSSSQTTQHISYICPNTANPTLTSPSPYTQSNFHIRANFDRAVAASIKQRQIETILLKQIQNVPEKYALLNFKQNLINTQIASVERILFQAIQPHSRAEAIHARLILGSLKITEPLLDRVLQKTKFKIQKIIFEKERGLVGIQNQKDAQRAFDAVHEFVDCANEWHKNGEYNFVYDDFECDDAQFYSKINQFESIPYNSNFSSEYESHAHIQALKNVKNLCKQNEFDAAYAQIRDFFGHLNKNELKNAIEQLDMLKTIYFDAYYKIYTDYGIKKEFTSDPYYETVLAQISKSPTPNHEFNELLAQRKTIFESITAFCGLADLTEKERLICYNLVDKIGQGPKAVIEYLTKTIHLDDFDTAYLYSHFYDQNHMPRFIGYDPKVIENIEISPDLGLKQRSLDRARIGEIIHHASDGTIPIQIPRKAIEMIVKYGLENIRNASIHAKRTNSYIADIHDPTTTNVHYEISLETKQFLEEHKIDPDNFIFCSGTRLQHILHQEFLDINEKNQWFNDLAPVANLYELLNEFTVVGIKLNRNNNLDKSLALVDFGWKALDCLLAIGEGACQGGINTLNTFIHPIQTVEELAHGIKTLGKALGHVTLRLYDINATLITDFHAGSIKLEAFIHDSKILCNCLINEIKAIELRDGIKGITSIAVEGFLTGKALGGIHKFLRASQIKAVKIVSESAPRVEDITSLATAEGIEIKIARQAIETMAKQTAEKSVRLEKNASCARNILENSQLASRVTEIMSNMTEFFSTEFGKKVKIRCNKTKFIKDGQSIYKVTQKINKNLKKNYYFYLDNLHKNHFEVFDKEGCFKHVLNLDGSKNQLMSEKLKNSGRFITI